MSGTTAIAGAPAPLALKAIVKSVTSGDTLVLRSRAAPQPGQAAQERLLHLAHLQAPRLGNRDRQDELYALQSRDFLRTMVVGREISFEVIYTVPGNASTGSGQMEFGDVILSKPDGTNVDVALAVVAAGASKVRESRNTEQEGAAEQGRKQQLREAEEAAKAAGKGIWEEGLSRPEVSYNMPDDPDAFLAEHGKGKQLEACIEAVNNGSTVRARLQTGPDSYQIVNVACVSRSRSETDRALTLIVATEWQDAGPRELAIQTQMRRTMQPIPQVTIRASLSAMKPASSRRLACCSAMSRCNSLPCPRHLSPPLLVRHFSSATCCIPLETSLSYW